MNFIKENKTNIFEKEIMLKLNLYELAYITAAVGENYNSSIRDFLERNGIDDKVIDEIIYRSDIDTYEILFNKLVDEKIIQE